MRTGGKWMRKLILTLALTLLVHPATSQTSDDATRAYMLCVRRNAESLEPSGDPPQDVARAAVFLCGREEGVAFNFDISSAGRLRETALFYGAGQATVARACRIAKRCGFAPIPNSN
jgi:hypothetical protein